MRKPLSQTRWTGYYVLGNTLITLALIVVAGCGSGGPGSPSSDSSSSQKNFSSANTEKHALLDEYLPPLDEGRIEVAPPKGWYLPPRSAKYLFRVQRTSKEALPVIALTGQDWPEFSALDSKTTGQFIKALASEHQKDPKTYRPIQIANRTWVAYRRRAREPGRVARVLDVLALETVVGGRRYTLRLVCEASELDQWEPYLQAVAQGIRFGPEATLAAKGTSPAGTVPSTSEEKEIAGVEVSGETVPEVPPSGGKEIPPSTLAKIPAPADVPKKGETTAKPQKPAPEEPVLDLDALEELLR